MGAEDKVLPNPSQDRDNGGVALPAYRRCANPRFPKNQPPGGCGKPRCSRLVRFDEAGEFVDNDDGVPVDEFVKFLLDE